MKFGFDCLSVVDSHDRLVYAFIWYARHHVCLYLDAYHTCGLCFGATGTCYTKHKCDKLCIGVTVCVTICAIDTYRTSAPYTFFLGFILYFLFHSKSYSSDFFFFFWI